MVIDIVFAILMVLAIMKGFQRGLIVGFFSLIAIIIGLAAALKLSAVVAARIGDNVNVSKEWLPVISFALVFLVVVLLIRIGAAAIEKAVQVALLGWVNRLGGIIFFVLIYTIVYSIVLFYVREMDIVSADAFRASVIYPYIDDLGPGVINGFAALVPWFRDMFTELETFFDGLSKKI